MPQSPLFARIGELQENLELLYEQRNALEKGALLTPDDEKATQNLQKLRTKVRPKIREYEEELFTLLQQESPGLIFGEADAQATIEVISQEVRQLQQQPDLAEEMLALLQRIEAKLNEPGVTADAKLKGTLSIFPPFIGLSYEGQLDTENFCRKYFPTFTRLLKGAKKS
ncbi:MAG: hypothetical protein VKJ24_18495 [Synechococcales bacterium]|nr:hypothetical protein [Synechococcales bacterium]